ncbi:MAG: hypothetical protein HKP61_07630 [Dactylosporangium sp.]|nr:hypothetical protein [Dactylosporangium sp.]NNJ60806.1 hypothetical protein [Dactylosporangium sp.]
MPSAADTGPASTGRVPAGAEPVRRLAHLRWGLAASGILLLTGAPVGFLAAGWAGVAGFAAGVGLVVASYSVSSLVIAWADSIEPALIMPFGLTTYAMKFTGLIVLLAALDDTAWRGRTALGLGLIVAAVCWSAAQVSWIVRNGATSRA